MTVRQALGFYFGHNHFRLNQEVIVNQILAGRDVCAILPTGAGKSICYQLPALMLAGTTLVVSPLISLMRDQVRQLQNRGLSAEALTSGQTKIVQNKVLAQFSSGRLKILYVSPERLTQPQFLSVCQKVNISLVVVDEAHCISQWGHDFRPEYGQIAQFIQSLPQRPRVVALTATATQRVEQDLISNLKLSNPFVLRASVVRSNLSIQISQTDSTNWRMIYLLRLLQHLATAKVIVYCQTRRTTRQLATLIDSLAPDLNPLAYHAGLSAQDRRQVEDTFHHHRTGVICATTAFGMGIDLPDIRAVIHYGLPASIEQYYQEIGRAGRDGLRSATYLLTHPGDIEIITAINQSDSPQVTQLNQRRLSALTAMINSPRCRMGQIAQYFGEKQVADCGKCDRCVKKMLTSSGLMFLTSETERQILIHLLNKRGELTDKQLCWLAVTQPRSEQALCHITGFSQALSNQLWPIVRSFMVK